MFLTLKQQAAELRRISCLSIPTHGCISCLSRAFTSVVAHARAFGHQCDVLIADDSFSACHSWACKAMLRHGAAKGSLSVFYAGQDEKRNYANLLTDDGDIPPQVVQFAIFGLPGFGTTIGANRNTLLLHSVGSMCLSVDDDVICKVFAPPQISASGLKLACRTDLGELWFFPDFESAVSSVDVQDTDIIAAHETMLGRRLIDILEEKPSASVADTEDMCGAMRKGLYSTKGRVVVTLNGCVGDSGFFSEKTVLTYRNASTRDRMIASDRAYTVALNSRYVIRQVPSRTICHPEPLMATIIGMDNRELLPPFFPLYRNEDGLFARTLALSVDQGYCGHIPLSLLHAPHSIRTYTPADFSAVRVSDIVLACLSSAHCHNTQRKSTAERLDCVGRHLADLGSLRVADFTHLYKQLVRARALQQIGRLENLLAEGRAPDACHWRMDIDHHLSALTDMIRQPTFGAPIDLALKGSPEASLMALRQLVLQFGNLLRWWPAIIEKANSLVDNRDRRIGARIY
jgi:hypothetical protein